jgi:outer membrane receptor protein involved in Fe transport
LYSNHNYYVDNFGSQPSFGNPNVNMQKSVQYEMGLQQGLTEDFKMDLTAFYKDVRDYIFSQTVFTQTGRQYNVLTNLAYSNVRGVTLSFLKRRARNSLFYATLDYTFQVAEGNRTYPSEDLFFSEQSNEMSEMYLVPLSFDRSHTITSTIGLNKPNDWTFGIIGNLRTGTPYTPILPSQLQGVLTYEQNSDRKPVQWNIDLKFEKFFEIGPFEYSLFLQVYNLFDTENQQFVYASTGESLRSVDPAVFPFQFNNVRNRIERGDPGMFSEDVIDNYYSKRPERVSSPREIRLGFSILFN